MTAEHASIPLYQDSFRALFRIIYMSECNLPSEGSARAMEIEHIFKWSREWNKAHYITGALLFSAGHFSQVLEGPERAIRELLGNIVCDRRHRRFTVLESGPVSQRLFGNWSMAYVDGNEQVEFLFMDLLGKPNASQGASIVAMLRHIVTTEEIRP